MPAPSYPLPPSLPPLHLYRHVLREASYLPPAFREAISSTVRDRFHRHRRHDVRAKAHISRATSALRTLRAANSGDAVAMADLISKGFGRTGPRRREIMARFVKSQGPSNLEELEAVLDAPDAQEASSANEHESQPETQPQPEAATRRRRNKRNTAPFFHNWDREKLLQLAKSQKEHQQETRVSTSWRGLAFKNADPNQFVPALNIWGKPPAEILVRAKQAHWWKRSADKLSPPLGKGEWDLLARLSSGAQDEAEWAIPPRRASAKPVAAADVDGRLQAFDYEAWATHPAATVEKQSSHSRRRRSGRRDDGPYAGSGPKTTLSARWFRRAYNRTWQVTPTVSQDPNTLKHTFSWGVAPTKLPPPTRAQLEALVGKG